MPRRKGSGDEHFSAGSVAASPCQRFIVKYPGAMSCAPLTGKRHLAAAIPVTMPSVACCPA